LLGFRCRHPQSILPGPQRCGHNDGWDFILEGLVRDAALLRARRVLRHRVGDCACLASSLSDASGQQEGSGHADYLTLGSPVVFSALPLRVGHSRVSTLAATDPPRWELGPVVFSTPPASLACPDFASKKASLVWLALMTCWDVPQLIRSAECAKLCHIPRSGFPVVPISHGLENSEMA
jgi:hypothetical protein